MAYVGVSREELKDLTAKAAANPDITEDQAAVVSVLAKSAALGIKSPKGSGLPDYNIKSEHLELLKQLAAEPVAALPGPGQVESDNQDQDDDQEGDDVEL